MANYITTLKDDNEVDTLSPTTVLKAIRDDNGNYLDNGLAASDINKLKGGEVVKLEENLARIETSPTTHAYSVGERLVYNGILYRVKAAISVGADLVVNTNIEKKSVDDALSDIIKLTSLDLTTNSNGYTYYDFNRQVRIISVYLRGRNGTNVNGWMVGFSCYSGDNYRYYYFPVYDNTGGNFGARDITIDVLYQEMN